MVVSVNVLKFVGCLFHVSHDQKVSLNLYQMCQISSKASASLTDVKGQLQQLPDCTTLFSTACKDLRGSPTDMGPAACQLSY